MTSCHSSKNKRVERVSEDYVGVIVSDLSVNANTKSLISEARNWLGVPYRYGGNTKEGVDCSGMVVQVFLKATGLKLPRTCAKQAEYCNEIKEKDVKTGDLVFFATGNDTKKITHVGIMIDMDNFIHASSSKGVTISQLSSPYFKRTLRKIGRVPS